MQQTMKGQLKRSNSYKQINKVLQKEVSVPKKNLSRDDIHAASDLDSGQSSDESTEELDYNDGDDEDIFKDQDDGESEEI